MLIVGVDEAGRGPLVGPVVASACFLPDNFPINQVKDSKQLTEKQRERLYTLLTTFPGVVYAVEIVSEQVIDEINILQATLLAMTRAVESIACIPSRVLVDGNVLPALSYPAQAIVSGDSLCPCISAASILAKVTRDAIVRDYDALWPEWQFSKHKGYGTKHHLSMIKKHGILPVHRRSFEPIKSIVSMTNTK